MPFYHFYFNNNIEETDKDYFDEGDKVTKIKLITDHPIKSFYELFADCECIESINFKKFYRNNINDMRSMFCRCSSLKKIKFY